MASGWVVVNLEETLGGLVTVWNTRVGRETIARMGGMNQEIKMIKVLNKVGRGLLLALGVV